MKSLYRVLKNQPDDVLGLEKNILYPEFAVETKKEEKVIPEVEEKEEEAAEEEQVSAADILADIYAEGKLILDAAKREAEDVRTEAYQIGFTAGSEAGYKEGREQALNEYDLRFEAEFKNLQKRLADYIKEVEITKERLLEQHIEDLKNISLAIGEKIVQTSLRSSSEVVERMILSATGRLKKSAWAKIYIGKGQETMDVRGDVQFLQELSKLSDNVKIIMLEEEDTGTCIVELPDEIIDMSVGTQLENIKEILNNARL
ncbi:hypothetical protein [Faecalicatena contorta]|uniref:Flagellar assembly protein FliH n=1 Tax=Faecalicatena contorta TaxID=39482 RepID=A0A316A3L5_9FIRM|nr:hypothetical protein [Faecalicatena contorta]PWJ52481.1 flagellar assembly protein FliH [Faecalicatena contorta]SUQ12759.1 flagellar assembly protein FliH [Faecalicatena contorta]